MKTKIPKEDGWYWMATPHYSTQRMCRVFTDGAGYRGISVMHVKNTTGFTVYPDPSMDLHCKDLEGAIFTKIKVPR